MRAYRWLLHLYPASFRAEYGEEMCAFFAARARDAQGSFARVLLWLTAIGDVMANAAAVQADILRQDLRYTVRTLRRAPAFTLTAIAVIAIGIGANTAAFSVTDFVLLRALPFPRPDRLVKIWERTPGYARLEVSTENYRDYKRLARSFESMGAVWSTSANLVVPGSPPERLEGASITWDLLPTLGARPLLGRTFSEAEDREGAPGTVILSYGLWRSLFGGDPNVLGKQVVLDDERCTVIGVMPADFAYPSTRAELWRPLRPSPDDTDRTNNYLQVVARLTPGATLGDARAEMAAIASRLAAQFPKEDSDTSTTVIRLGDEVPRQSRVMVLALGGAAGCVLLIVCANLANLLMARALTRRKEIAVRAAIGAGRERLVRQLVTESAVLAAAGGVLGVAVAYLTVPLLAQLAPVSLPTAAGASVNVRVLLFATALTVVTGLAFGLVPALRVGRSGDAAGLREGARGGARREGLRQALVVAEIVASIVLLAGAGLLVRALWTIERVDPGFRTENVLTLRTALAWPKYAPTEKRAAFYTRVLEQVRALPGVTDAAYISFLPMVMRGGIWAVALRGDTGARAADHAASLRYVTPGFFRTLDIPLKKGRDVAEADAQNSLKVAVVSESFARQYFPGEDPIGKRFTIAFFERTIVGVAGDIRVRGLEGPSEPQVYVPYRQIPDGYMSIYAPKDLAIKASTPPARLVPAVRAIIRGADPDEPVSDVRLLSDIVEDETTTRSGQVRVLGAFALVAVLLAGVGIHGLLAFGVSQRMQEFGVRMALGARPGEIAGLVVRRGIRLALAGAVPGVLLAYAAGRAVEALLAGVPPGDPLTFAGVALFAAVMTIAGSLVPALRAFRVNPLEALRAEV